MRSDEPNQREGAELGATESRRPDAEKGSADGGDPPGVG